MAIRAGDLPGRPRPARVEGAADARVDRQPHRARGCPVPATGAAHRLRGHLGRRDAPEEHRGMTRGYVIYGPTPWDGPANAAHNLARALAAGHPVLYVEPPLSPLTPSASGCARLELEPGRGAARPPGAPGGQPAAVRPAGAPPARERPGALAVRPARARPGGRRGRAGRTRPRAGGARVARASRDRAAPPGSRHGGGGHGPPRWRRRAVGAAGRLRRGRGRRQVRGRAS